MKKLTSLILSLLLLFSFAACGGKDTSDATSNSADNNKPAAATEIYFLNFKPEIASVYEKIAKEYKKKTGVTVKVAPGVLFLYFVCVTVKSLPVHSTLTVPPSVRNTSVPAAASAARSLSSISSAGETVAAA